MNALAESIPTVFNPETTFAIALHNANERRDRANAEFVPYRFELPPRNEFERPGIPESALHD